MFDALVAKVEPILAWFNGGKFMVQNDICVDDVCVTKEQFKQMLLNSGGAQSVSGGGSLIGEIEIIPPDETASSTPEVIAEEPSPEPEPTTLEPAPEPVAVDDAPPTL